jgi:hypothetical protein
VPPAGALTALYPVAVTQFPAYLHRDGVGHNLAYIDDDFTESYLGLFDPGYMNKLSNIQRKNST